MTVYLLNLFSIPIYALLLYFVGIDNRKKNRILCGLAGLQLLLTAALRATTVGGDLENYVPLYSRLGKEDWSEVFTGRIEPGYMFLNKILTLFSTDERLLLVVIGGIVVAGFCAFIYKNSRILWLSLFLFVALGIYTTSLSMLRQSIAIVFTLMSIRYVERRSFWKFSMLVGTAVLFHYTAITFFILYPLARFKPTWGYFLCLLGGGFVCAWLLGKMLLVSLIERYYSIYEGTMAGGTGDNMLLLLIAVTAFGLLTEGRQKYDRRRNILTHMMILACCFQCMALHFGLMARIVLYFSVSQLVFLPNAISYMGMKDLKFLAVSSVFVLSFSYFVVFVLGNDSCGILPYRFMWE